MSEPCDVAGDESTQNLWILLRYILILCEYPFHVGSLEGVHNKIEVIICIFIGIVSTLNFGLKTLKFLFRNSNENKRENQ